MREWPRGRGGPDSRWWDSDPRPRLYESRALPLSYIGKFRSGSAKVRKSAPKLKSSANQRWQRPCSCPSWSKGAGVGQVSPRHRPVQPQAPGDPPGRTTIAPARSRDGNPVSIPAPRYPSLPHSPPSQSSNRTLVSGGQSAAVSIKKPRASLTGKHGAVERGHDSFHIICSIHIRLNQMEGAHF